MVDQPSHHRQRGCLQVALPRLLKVVERIEYCGTNRSKGAGRHSPCSEKQDIRIHIKNQRDGLSLCHAMHGRGKSGQRRAPYRLTAWWQKCYVTGTETSRLRAGETTTLWAAIPSKPTLRLARPSRRVGSERNMQ